MFEALLLGLSSAVNLLLGLTVYQKNPKSATGRLFLFLTSSFTLWSVVNYISLHPFYFPQIVWVRLVLSCAALMCLAVYLTFLTFPSSTLGGSRRWRRLAIAYTAFMMVLVLTPVVFHVDASGKPAPNTGIPLFAVLVVSLLGSGIVTLIRKLQRSTGRVRSQLKLVLFGLASTFALILISNFLLVVTFNFHGLIALAPVYTLLFCGTVAYAIIRHRLFDIRAAVARSVGYILIIATMSLLYGGILFGVIDIIFPGTRHELLRQLLSVALVVPLAASFQRVKGFFDRTSSRIFYRSYYDPQEVLNRLSSTLVHSIDIVYLKAQSAHVLQRAVRATSLHYWLAADSDKASQHAQLLRRLYTHNRASNIVLAEDLDSGSEVADHLREQGIAVVVRLRTNVEALGYMTLGYKESGEVYSDRDIQLLRIAADEIAISLQNAIHFAAIQNFNQTLQEKVAQATRELRRTNEKLKELDETKDDFISMASHQLRTPLTSVKGYLSMVLEGDAGKINDTQAKMLGQAYTSSQRMVYLIADLLNVSRLKTGKFVIEPKPTDLSRMIEEEIGQLTESAAARDQTLHYDKPDNFPQLMLDETKTRQVIMNFVDNAIYYTPNGGHIRVELADDGPMVELRVVDDGMGVPKAEQHHLFTKFYRAGNARKARPDGTGLGLFMAKKVVTAQGGAILFESVEGKGSTFGFTFSKAKLKVPDQPAAKAITPAAHK